MSKKGWTVRLPREAMKLDHRREDFEIRRRGTAITVTSTRVQMTTAT